MYKAVIGLEVHCELETKSKNFSSAPNQFSKIPNQHVAPTDLGLPGILPVVNKEACKKALLTAIALHCENPNEIIFDRKNYFYPDLPKGYQITQVTKPMGKNGYLDILVQGKWKRVGIHQLHLEEDTASLEHDKNYTLIDYNRSGVPLIEIVTEPCLETSEEAITFLEDLKDIFLYLGVSEAKSNYGQMRCDVNISVKKEESTELGTKVEMKNINAFHRVKQAIDYEIKRQINQLENGEKILQETRRIAEDGKTYAMREKVDAIDYKYFIEPNIPSTKITNEYLNELKKMIPKLKMDRYIQYIEKYKMKEEDAKVLVKNKKIADYFEQVQKNCHDTELVIHFMTTFILSTLNKLEISLEELWITEEMLSKVIQLVEKGQISLDHGKKILYQSIEKKIDPIELIKKENLHQINDEKELIVLIKKIMEENPEQVRQYIEEDNFHVINFFIGQTMKQSNRQANPNKSLELIQQELERRKQNEQSI